MTIYIKLYCKYETINIDELSKESNVLDSKNDDDDFFDDFFSDE